MAGKLEIREQADLPLSKQATIALDGIHHRLFRSLLTLGVVILAVAFLANVLVENSMAGASKRGVRALALQQRELAVLAVYIDTEMAPPELARRLEELPPDSWIVQSLAPWLGVPKGELSAFRRDLSALLRYDAWFDNLAPGHQRILAGKRAREEVFASLADPDERRRFEEGARSIPLLLPQGLMDFLARRQGVLNGLAAAASRLAAARGELAREMGGLGFADWLAAADSGTLAETLRARRLSIDEARLDALLRRARDRAVEKRLFDAMRDPALASAWRTQFGRVIDQKTALADLAGKPAVAGWFETQPAPRAAALNAAQAAQAARHLIAARELIEADELLSANYGASSGLSANMFWLLVVSFLVCIAGITNAMLISVIERFREIATMKCLGALNGFIARLFLLEAALLGLVGGILGVLLGGAIGIIRMTTSYGEWAMRFFPWGDLAASAGIAVVCGLGLATLSALYPAFAAARMLPMEAMRVE